MNEQRSDPIPLTRFSAVYLDYIGVITAVVGPTAPLVLIFAQALPTFEATANLGGGLSFLLNLTMVGLVLFWRHSLLGALFASNGNRYSGRLIIRLALVLSIILCFFLLSLYLSIWSETREKIIEVYEDTSAVSEATLEQLPWVKLILCYCGSFFFLQLAFCIMALREYGQSVLGLSDGALLKAGHPSQMPSAKDV